MMEAISGTRRAMKEMADGTIRVQIDVDPTCRTQFLQLFPNIDMPVALAPLRADFEQPKPSNSTELKPKGGELARLAGQLCQNPEFLEYGNYDSPEEAAADIRFACQIESRAELDHNPAAAAIFHESYRKPFLAWKQEVAA